MTHNELFFFLQIGVNVALLFFCLWRGRVYLNIYHVFQILLANLLVYKQVNIFSMEITASDVFAIGTLLSLNMIREFYGKKAANEAIYSSFVFLVLYVVFVQIHLFFIPSQFDVTHDAYSLLMKPSLRIVSASLFTFLVVQKIDLYLFNIFKRIIPQYFSVRVFGCILLTNFIDTVMFSFLGLYGILHNLLDVMVVSYIIKLIISLISTSVLDISKNIDRKDEFIGNLK